MFCPFWCTALCLYTWAKIQKLLKLTTVLCFLCMSREIFDAFLLKSSLLAPHYRWPWKCTRADCCVTSSVHLLKKKLGLESPSCVWFHSCLNPAVSGTSFFFHYLHKLLALHSFSKTMRHSDILGISEAHPSSIQLGFIVSSLIAGGRSQDE